MSAVTATCWISTWLTSHEVVGKEPGGVYWHSLLDAVDPSGASCNGGGALRTEKGYWRSSNDAAMVYACKGENACAGDLNASKVLSGDATCHVGYHGPLCALCEPGYFSFSSGCT